MLFGLLLRFPNTEISELTQTEVVESEVYDSSEDVDFESKLISPRENHKLRNRVHEEDDDTFNTPLKTPTKTESRKSNMTNRHLVLNRDLRKHIEAQNRIIAELRRKLEIIRNVSSDAKYTNIRQILRDTNRITSDTQINILDGSECDEVLAMSPKSDSKNTINLHFH